MHFADLTLCRYHNGPFDANNWAVPLRAVGWLEDPHPFPTGRVPSALISRLQTLLEQTKAEYRQFGFRGVHDCSLCSSGLRKSPAEPGWSQENLFVPGFDAVFVAPGGILHYIEEHAYLPPSEFLDALERCPDVASVEYRQALQRANAGAQPPLDETWTESLARSRALAEEIAATRRLRRSDE